MNREKTLLTQMGITIGMIVLCLAAMGFSAFAYFSHSVSSGMNMIQSANFGLEITDMTGVAEDASGTVVPENVYECKAAGTYTFTLKYDGTAETGYCKIEVWDQNKTVLGTFYTTQIFKNPDDEKGHLTSITVSVEVLAGCVIEFTPQWGTSSYYSVDQEILYGDNDKICLTVKTEESEEITYTVIEGDTLQKIAEKYGTTMENLIAYNKIQLEDADNIHVGDEIKIPPSDWTMPSETVKSTEAGTTIEE